MRATRCWQGVSIWPDPVMTPLRPPHGGQSKFPGKAEPDFDARLGNVLLPRLWKIRLSALVPGNRLNGDFLFAGMAASYENGRTVRR